MSEGTYVRLIEVKIVWALRFISVKKSSGISLLLGIFWGDAISKTNITNRRPKIERLSGESLLEVKSLVDGIREEMVYVLFSLKLQLSTLIRLEL